MQMCLWNKWPPPPLKKKKKKKVNRLYLKSGVPKQNPVYW